MRLDDRPVIDQLLNPNPMEALRADIKEAAQEAWAKCSDARGASTQALWQGRYDAYMETLRILEARL